MVSLIMYSVLLALGIFGLLIKSKSTRTLSSFDFLDAGTGAILNSCVCFLLSFSTRGYPVIPAAYSAYRFVSKYSQ